MAGLVSIFYFTLAVVVLSIAMGYISTVVKAILSRRSNMNNMFGWLNSRLK